MFNDENISKYYEILYKFQSDQLKKKINQVYKG